MLIIRQHEALQEGTNATECLCICTCTPGRTGRRRLEHRPTKTLLWHHRIAPQASHSHHRPTSNATYYYITERSFAHIHIGSHIHSNNSCAISRSTLRPAPTTSFETLAAHSSARCAATSSSYSTAAASNGANPRSPAPASSRTAVAAAFPTLRRACPFLASSTTHATHHGQERHG